MLVLLIVIILDQNTNTHGINYVRILRKYVEGFVRTNALEAFHYLYLLKKPKSLTSSLSLPSSASHSFMFTPNTQSPQRNASDSDAAWEPDESHIAMRDLLLETRDFELLVGTVKNEVVIKNGLLYQYYKEDEAQHLLLLTASEAQTSGQIVDAIQLLTLAEVPTRPFIALSLLHMFNVAMVVSWFFSVQRFDRVAIILIEHLARVVSSSAQNLDRQQLVDLAARFHSMAIRPAAGAPHRRSRNGQYDAGSDMMYEDIGGKSNVSEEHMGSLLLLLKLVQFFDLYHIGDLQRFEDALDVIASIGIIPMSDDGNELEDKVTV